MRPITKLTLLALGVSGTLAAPAAAAPFGEPVAVPGFGEVSGGALLAGSAIDAAGRTVLGGTVGDPRRATLAFGAPGGAPSAARRFGPSGAYDADLASNADGDVALTFSVGNRAYLTVCRRGSCRPTQRVGAAAAKPESVVAVQPGSGRTTVLWRGRTGGGTPRLRWRITTGGRLGPTHTLGEFGDRPRLVTDRSGKSVAIWRGREDRRLRTAARRVGEFTRPEAISAGPVGGQRLAVADNRFVAAWLTAPGGIDVQDPAGTVQTAARYDDSAFSTPQSSGPGAAVDVAAAPDGRALLSILDIEGTRVLAATAPPFGRFGAPRELAASGFLSTAVPPRGAIDAAGNAIVAFSGQPDLAVSATLTVVRAAAGDAFGAPESFPRGAASREAPGGTAVALGAGLAQVAVSADGRVELRRAPLG